tara:strand:- start:31 stop:282 length:252 start_codon:yes stop_codon:yes gene_type:complete
MLLHKRLKAGFKHMGINLGRGDIGMTKKRLDHAQIGTVGQKMRGKGMAQGMRRDLVGINMSFDRYFFDKVIKSMAREMPGGTP